MYDENQIYDETIQAVKNTGRDAKTIIDLVNSIKNRNSEVDTDRLSAVPENVPEVQVTTNNSDFVFTGQSTDLRYFRNNSEMPISMIDNIPDAEVRNAVKDEFNKAALSGRINIDNNTGKITITEKGKEFIDLPSFKKAVSLDVNRMAISQGQVLGIELDGNVTDLNFFNHADKLDLNNIISNPDTQTASKVLANFNVLKEQGFVNIDNSIVTITPKGKDLLNTSLFKTASKGITEKAAASAGVPGKIFVITKKASDVLISSSGARK